MLNKVKQNTVIAYATRSSLLFPSEAIVTAQCEKNTHIGYTVHIGSMYKGICVHVTREFPFNTKLTLPPLFQRSEI